MGDSLFDVKFKGQGFTFAIIEKQEGYKLEFQAVLYNDSLKWRKEIGFSSDSYLEALAELEYFHKYGFDFGGVVYKPIKEVVYG